MIENFILIKNVTFLFIVHQRVIKQNALIYTLVQESLILGKEKYRPLRLVNKTQSRQEKKILMHLAHINQT